MVAEAQTAPRRGSLPSMCTGGSCQLTRPRPQAWAMAIATLQLKGKSPNQRQKLQQDPELALSAFAVSKHQRTHAHCAQGEFSIAKVILGESSNMSSARSQLMPAGAVNADIAAGCVFSGGARGRSFVATLFVEKCLMRRLNARSWVHVCNIFFAFSLASSVAMSLWLIT